MITRCVSVSVSGRGSGHQQAAGGSEVISVFFWPAAAAGSEGSGSSPAQHAEPAEDLPDAAAEASEPRSEPEPQRRELQVCRRLADGCADGTDPVRAAEPAAPSSSADQSGSQRRPGPVQRE